MIRLLPGRDHPIVRKDARSRPRRTRLGQLSAGPVPHLAVMVAFPALWITLWYVSDFWFQGYYGSYPAFAVHEMLTQFTASLIVVICAGGWATGLIAAGTGSPLLASELRDDTWEVLAVTPLTTTEIVRAKFVAGMWRMHHWLLAQVAARALLIVALVLLAFMDSSDYGYSFGLIYSGQDSVSPLLLIVLVPPMVFMLVQPLFTAAAGLALGMLASAFTKSPALARGLAVMTRLVTWAVVWVLMLRVLINANLSPMVGYLFTMAGHLHAPPDVLIYELSRDSGSWLVLLAGLPFIAALALVPAWQCLKLTAVALDRRRL